MVNATRETDSDGFGDRAGGRHPLIGKLERALARGNIAKTERFLGSICGRPALIAASLGDVERLLGEHGQLKLLEAAILNSLAAVEHPRRILRQFEDFAIRHQFLDAFQQALAQETVIAEPPGTTTGEPATLLDRAERLAGRIEVDARAEQLTADVTSLLPQAVSLLQAADNLGAAALLERLVAADPNNAMMRARLATAYLRAVVQIEPDDPAEAERLLLRVLELDVMQENARLFYAMFLRRHGRHLKTAQRPGDVPAAGAGETEMHFRLGAKAYRARDYAASADYLEQVLAADPRHGRAMNLLPGACYRAGRLDHPSLDPARHELSGQVRFADGLTNIARAIGVEAADDDGGLPDRAGWTEAQRYAWGRRVDALIRYQVLGGPDTLADLQHRTRPLALPPGPAGRRRRDPAAACRLGKPRDRADRRERDTLQTCHQLHLLRSGLPRPGDRYLQRPREHPAGADGHGAEAARLRGGRRRRADG